MLRLLRSPAPIRRFYSTAVVKDLNELDEVLFKYSALPKDDRIAALRILNKENGEKVAQFKTAIEKLSTKKNSNTVEGMLQSRREAHFNRVNALKNALTDREANQLAAELVGVVHSAAVGFLKADNLDKYLKDNNTHSDKHVERLEKALGMSLTQLSNLQQTVGSLPSLVHLTKEGQVIVNLCANSLRIFEREFSQSLASSGGDVNFAQKAAVTQLLWKIQKRLLGEQHALEDKHLQRSEE